MRRMPRASIIMFYQPFSQYHILLNDSVFMGRSIYTFLALKVIQYPFRFQNFQPKSILNFNIPLSFLITQKGSSNSPKNIQNDLKSIKRMLYLSNLNLSEFRFFQDSVCTLLANPHRLSLHRGFRQTLFYPIPIHTKNQRTKVANSLDHIFHGRKSMMF